MFSSPFLFIYLFVKFLLKDFGLNLWSLVLVILFYFLIIPSCSNLVLAWNMHCIEGICYPNTCIIFFIKNSPIKYSKENDLCAKDMVLFLGPLGNEKPKYLYSGNQQVLEFCCPFESWKKKKKKSLL